MELIETAQVLRFLFALLFVLALMGGLALILRRLEAGKSLIKSVSKRRLQIVEMLPLDARRRLVLIRRDDTEHLVILGPAGETVVEAGIEISRTENAEKEN